MNKTKQKKALQLFQQTFSSENLTPGRNKDFYTTMADDGLDNLNINIDYQNYSVIASGGDIIITPDDEGEDIIIHPSTLKASYISYVPSSGSTVTVQTELDNINEQLENITSEEGLLDYNKLKNKPIINGITLQGDKNGHAYSLLNEIAIQDEEGPQGGPITNIIGLLNLT